MEYRTLYNGVKIPMLGLGVFQIPDYAQAKAVVATALETGYRLIDTAQAYGNEQAVGDAVKESGLPREEVFLTTKLWIQDFSYDGAIQAARRSMERLGVEYLDLLLLHQPMGDYCSAWRGLETLYREGKLRAIGMANCYPHVLADLCETFAIKPMLNQVELHPFFQQENALSLMREYGVQPEAWAPFAEGKHGIFTHPVLTKIGEKYGKGAGQVALRWNTQRGVAVIPKSTHKERMEQNLDIWDFRLTDEEMAEISALDIGHSEIIDHTDPKLVQALHGRKL